MTTSLDPRLLLGLHPSSQALRQFLASISPKEAVPEVKSYHDAVYFNYYFVGLSLLFSPTPGYRPPSGSKLGELEDENLVLDSIYFYNTPNKGSADRSRSTFSSYPASPLVLSLTLGVKDKDGNVVSRSEKIDVMPTTTGKDFVQAMKEPDRKGGGAGPSSGSIGIWCEWSKDGVMVEFGGEESIGPHAWERGADAVWKIITIFAPAL